MFQASGRSSADPAAPVIGRRVLIVPGLVERAGALQWRNEPAAWASRPRQDRRVYRMLRSVHNAGLERRAGLLLAFLEVVAQPAALAWYRHQVAS